MLKRDGSHIVLGRRGEEAACGLLRRAGLRILDRNWRAGRLELDIVCQDGATVVFVEVKTRSSAERGGPEGALTPAKQRSLSRAAQAWLAAHGAWEAPCRFDVVCLVARDGTFSAEHYRHAFDFAPPLDRRHAAWQPW
ncbi:MULTISPECIES: YraN family protein [unclassified Desulfovibrio]|uniref:YraN family protein n=1 Tax=unclassified Desulfovibrio TaxID=2593640 RepID=UPI001F156172|nr:MULTISPECIES: YraN family protein [unclassified Desulfovibrio]